MRSSPSWLLGIAASAAAAFGAPGCASGGSHESASNSVFAKSLREADPTKKAPDKAEPRKDAASPKASEFKLPGRRVYFEYVDAKQTLAMVNRGGATPAEIEGRQAANKSVFMKVATDDLMADMCEAMRRLDFAKLADTETSTADPLWILTMDVDGQKRSLRYIRGRDAERQRSLTNLQGTFLSGFNRVYGLRSMGADEGGRALFEQEKSKVKTQNQKSLEKANEKP